MPCANKVGHKGLNSIEVCKMLIISDLYCQIYFNCILGKKFSETPQRLPAGAQILVRTTNVWLPWPCVPALTSLNVRDAHNCFISISQNERYCKNRKSVLCSAIGFGKQLLCWIAFYIASQIVFRPPVLSYHLCHSLIHLGFCILDQRDIPLLSLAWCFSKLGLKAFCWKFWCKRYSHFNNQSKQY